VRRIFDLIWSSLRYLRFGVKLARQYMYDFVRYMRYSASVKPHDTQDRYQGRIIAHYHVIEKGLSLAETRVGFGSDVVNNLVDLLEGYREKYGLDGVGQVALNVLSSYCDFNLEHGHEIDKELHERIISLRNSIRDKSALLQEGGVMLVRLSDIQRKARVDFKGFVDSRHSVRHFARGEVDGELIEEAISMAIRTPSACNRQAWRVHLVCDPDLKRRVLSHQTGNRGFGNAASKLLIVTVDLSYFSGIGERNQGFIDGGMFAMTIVYALHSLGLGSCCLNWCVSADIDLALRQEIGIGDSETILMMIAVGRLPDEFLVACSSRKSVSQILLKH